MWPALCSSPFRTRRWSSRPERTDGSAVTDRASFGRGGCGRRRHFMGATAMLGLGFLGGLWRALDGGVGGGRPVWRREGVPLAPPSTPPPLAPASAPLGRLQRGRRLPGARPPGRGLSAPPIDRAVAGKMHSWGRSPVEHISRRPRGYGPWRGWLTLRACISAASGRIETGVGSFFRG